MNKLPNWSLKNKPHRPKGCYTFITWNYFEDENSPLQPSWLLGPIKVIAEA